jgi:uncharacterized protein (DUF1778 family)
MRTDGELAMARIAVEDNQRMSLRIRAADKSLLLRAVALKNTDLTEFVLGKALQAAKQIVDQSERIQVSGRDSARVLQLLENPPRPNRRMMAAARALPKMP